MPCHELRRMSVAISRSSRPETFLRKGILKICSKFTGEHPCWRAISMMFPVHLLYIFRTPLDGCFCISHHSVQHYMWIPEHATIKAECSFLIISYVLLIERWLYLKNSQFQISSKIYRKNVCYLSISFFVLFLIFNDFMISFPRCIFLSKARKFLFCKSHKII